MDNDEFILSLKEDFDVVTEGHHYDLPVYEIEEGEGLKRLNGRHSILFVRGSKDEDEHVADHAGILHESLLAMMIHDLKVKNEEVPSRETSLTITKLEEALHWQRQRQVERQKRDVDGTKQE